MTRCQDAGLTGLPLQQPRYVLDRVGVEKTILLSETFYRNGDQGRVWVTLEITIDTDSAPVVLISMICGQISNTLIFAPVDYIAIIISDVLWL
jgi:hypothetical protein